MPRTKSGSQNVIQQFLWTASENFTPDANRELAGPGSVKTNKQTNQEYSKNNTRRTQVTSELSNGSEQTLMNSRSALLCLHNFVKFLYLHPCLFLLVQENTKGGVCTQMLPFPLHFYIWKPTIYIHIFHFKNKNLSIFPHFCNPKLLQMSKIIPVPQGVALKEHQMPLQKAH